MITKKQIRELMRLRAASFNDEQGASERICDAIGKLPDYAAARIVLCYMALPGEVPLQTLMDAGDKIFVIPKVRGELLELREYHPSMTAGGYMGIIEPSDEAPQVSPSEIELALVPGVAFDRAGHRLGHGKGFYDRLLPQLHCPAVGVCFGYRITDEVPADVWDVPMNRIITENDGKD